MITYENNELNINTLDLFNAIFIWKDDENGKEYTLSPTEISFSMNDELMITPKYYGEVIKGEIKDLPDNLTLPQSLSFDLLEKTV